MAWYENEPIGRKRKSTHLAKKKMKFCQFREKNNCNHLNDVDKNNIRNKESLLRKEKRKRIRNNHVCFQFLLKLFFVFSVLVLVYGVYLDYQIRKRIDGKIWQLPAAVYGRMINLEPNVPISKNEMIKLLKATQYHQTKEVMYPGEFTVYEKSIEMIRRPFDFPDSKEGQVRACLTFGDKHLITIENMDSNRQFGFFRLDPRLISMLSSSNSEQRLFVARNDFPDILVNTLLTIEDRHFYKHDGISFYSICRALLANMSARHTVQGASTLTQQLVKNLFLTRERSYWRKVNEAYMALLMDAHYSKDRILELYMNEVYLGQNGDNEIRGFPLASLYYFGRPIKELSLDQQALLVGMVKGASIYNPWHNPKLALERRNFVLRLLQQRGSLDKDVYKMLIARPLGVLPRGRIISSQPAFMQMLRQELQKKLGSKIKDLSGVKIFTTFDYLAQDAAERAVSEGIPILKKQRNLKDLEIAIVIVDRYSGEVRAMIGGADTQYAGYNRAMQARRSIGSLAKPATFLAALSQPNKYRLNTWIADEPIVLHQPNGQVWSPQNDNRQFSCQVMLMDALALSMNVPTVNLGMSIGLPAITDIWKRLGVPKEQLYPVPAMILGAMNLIPVEVAQAFQTIANNGSRAPLSTLRFVIAEDGSVLYQSYPQAERVVSAQAAYMTMWSMQQVMRFGTGRQLGMKYPWLHLAGKTGTTNNSVDTWFVGIDGREVVITWVGRDNNQSTKLYGANGAMSIYQRYLERRFPIPLNLTLPEGVIDMEIDEAGNFVCSNGTRRVPVWTADPVSLCQNRQSEQLVDNVFHHSFQEQQQNNREDGKKISDWIRDIFDYN